jgi:hypothetical protein
MNINSKENQEAIEKIIENRTNEINRLIVESNRLGYCLKKMKCGCFGLDIFCETHGKQFSGSDEVALVKYFLTFQQ